MIDLNGKAGSGLNDGCTVREASIDPLVDLRIWQPDTGSVAARLALPRFGM
jgi:hypothetical protein